jgi:hypothetical protein
MNPWKLWHRIFKRKPYEEAVYLGVGATFPIDKSLEQRQELARAALGKTVVKSIRNTASTPRYADDEFPIG